MHLPAFAGSRIAPARFHSSPTARNYNLWRGFSLALVPMAASATTAGTFVRCGREIVQGRSNRFAGGVVLAGEACGPALKSVASGIAVDSKMPHAPPLSCFAFLVNRDTVPGNFQAVCGDKHGGVGGAWTFQLSYGAGQLGLTRWGLGDNPSTTLGAVPVAGAHSVVGMAWDGSTARFFLNGRFQSVASGGANGSTSGETAFFMRDAGNAPTNASFYVVYVWSRIVLDDEFLFLLQDPFALVRPPELPFSQFLGGGGGGSGARVQVAGFIG